MTTGKNEITTQRASEYDIALQRDGESDSEFRHRVAGALRAQGHIIEAHEAQNNALYNDPGQGGDMAMAGIMGAMALALSGQEFAHDDPLKRPRRCNAEGLFGFEDPCSARSALAERDGVSRVGHEMVAGLYVKHAPTPEERQREAQGLLMMVGMLDAFSKRH